jgi:hypothetical protein
MLETNFDALLFKLNFPVSQKHLNYSLKSRELRTTSRTRLKKKKMVMMDAKPYSGTNTSVHGVTITRTAKYVVSSSSATFHIGRRHLERPAGAPRSIATAEMQIC